MNNIHSRKKRFILSGSSNMLLMKRISETLAGRAVYFDMLPMAFSEMEGKTLPPKRFFNLWTSNFKVMEDSLQSVDPIPQDIPEILGVSC